MITCRVDHLSPFCQATSVNSLAFCLDKQNTIGATVGEKPDFHSGIYAFNSVQVFEGLRFFLDQ